MSYLLTLLIPQGAPPLGSRLHDCKGDYTFYPLPNDGAVWTLDMQIWKACSSKDEIKVAERFTPEIDEAVAALGNLESGAIVLAGIVEQELFHSVGSEQPIALPKFDEFLLRTGAADSKTLGFDVLDATGLSALTNVGLLPADLKSLSTCRLKTTEFGLLGDVASARCFAEFANTAAVEHAPFIEARVISIRMP